MAREAASPKKPDPTAVLQMASDLGVEPGRVLYVGRQRRGHADRPNAAWLGALGFRDEAELRKTGRPSSLYRPGAA